MLLPSHCCRRLSASVSTLAQCLSLSKVSIVFNYLRHCFYIWPTPTLVYNLSMAYTPIPKLDSVYSSRSVRTLSFTPMFAFKF